MGIETAISGCRGRSGDPAILRNPLNLQEQAGIRVPRAGLDSENPGRRLPISCPSKPHDPAILTPFCRVDVHRMSWFQRITTCPCSRAL